MFLRNWYNILKAVCYGCNGNNTRPGVKVNNLAGTSFDIYNCHNYTAGVNALSVLAAFPQNTIYSSNCNTITPYFKAHTIGASSPSIMGGPTVCFGSGVTPPTLDDYRLEKQHVDNLECVNNSINRVITDNTVMLEMSYTLKNISNVDALIAEVCIVVPVTYGYSQYSVHPCLIDRTVLAEPVTIAPGDMDVITYTIVYNLPSPD